MFIKCRFAVDRPFAKIEPLDINENIQPCRSPSAKHNGPGDFWMLMDCGRGKNSFADAPMPLLRNDSLIHLKVKSLQRFVNSEAILICHEFA